MSIVDAINVSVRRESDEGLFFIQGHCAWPARAETRALNEYERYAREIEFTKSWCNEKLNWKNYSIFKK